MQQCNLQDLSADAFIAEIISAQQQGYGITPFVGSGLSAPSGILMGQDFTEFLAYCTYLILCEDKSNGGRWNLTLQGWPKFPKPDEVQTAKNWIKIQYAEICDRYGYKPIEDKKGQITGLAPKGLLGTSVPAEVGYALNRPLVPSILRSWDGDQVDEVSQRLIRQLHNESATLPFVAPKGISPTSPDYVIECGIRSLYDWKATLDFLSRCSTKSDDGLPLGIGKPDLSLIDRFNSHITRDKQPNLAHKMLAHLSRPLRIRLVLTTNFDNLTESAFSRLSVPIKVIAVSSKGGLPSPETVAAQNTIIKMHGELLETRADFTVDEEPTMEDRIRFSTYIRGSAKQPRGMVPNNLLVIGYSGNDLRCVRMIQYLMDAVVDHKTKIFWVCYSDADKATVRQLFASKGHADRLFIHQTTHPQLLLYELYQNLLLCLPPGGLSYEFSHKVPPFRISTHFIPPEKVGCFAEEFLKQDKPVHKFVSRFCENDAPSVRARNAHELARDVLAAAAARCLQERIDSAAAFNTGQLSEIPGPLARYLRIVPLHDFGKTALQFSTSGGHGAAIVFDLSQGAVSALRKVFTNFSSRGGWRCLWLELQDYPTVEAVIRDISRLMALRVGGFHKDHLAVYPIAEVLTRLFRDELQGQDQDQEFPDEVLEKLIKKYDSQLQGIRDHFERVVKHYHIAPENWLFFLYGRDTPGGCASWSSATWQRSDYVLLHAMLRVLTSLGFHVVYAPLTQSRFLAKQARDKAVRSKRTTDGAPEYIQLLQNAHSQSKMSDSETADYESYSTYLNPIPDHESESWDPLVRTDIKQEVLGSGAFLNDFVIEAAFKAVNSKDHNLSPQNAIRLLYALTLFRQSRHTSSFFTEAVYSCPFRFNTDGNDNDWSRAIHVKQFVDALRRAGVLYDKSGGFRWIYRDTRLGLRHELETLRLLEQVPPKAPEPTSSVSLPIRVPVQDSLLWESRARMHFWIGDWYLKAYSASSHVNPVLESLHHRYECARFAQFARPKYLQRDKHATKLFINRVLLFRSALLEMLKVLAIARNDIKFWLANPLGNSTFAEFIESKSATGKLSPSDELSNSLSNIAKHHQDHVLVEECKALIWDLVEEVESLQNAIITEGGGTNHTKVIRLPHSLNVDTKTAAKVQIDLSFIAIGRNDWSQHGLTTLHGELLCDPIINVLQHLNAGFKSDDDRKGFEPILAKEKAEWITANATNQVRLYQMVHFLGEFAYLHVKRAKLEFHASDKVIPGRSVLTRKCKALGNSHVQCWLKATVLCNIALDYCKHLHPTYLHDELLLKVKLQTLYGLALANLDRSFEAHRHLNEALALLSKSGLGADSGVFETESAIVRLRRAEIYLTEAFRLRSVLTRLSEPKEFGAAIGDPTKVIADLLADYKALLGSHYKNPLHEVGRKIHPIIQLEYESNPTVASFVLTLCRKHTAALDDAWSQIESAEKLLSVRSHSSLWWGRLVALKMRVYAECNQAERGGKCDVIKRFTFGKLISRRRAIPGDGIFELFQQSIAISPHELFRQLRMLDYYWQATYREEMDDHQVEAAWKVIGPVVSWIHTAGSKLYSKPNSVEPRDDVQKDEYWIIEAYYLHVVNSLPERMLPDSNGKPHALKVPWNIREKSR